MFLSKIVFLKPLKNNYRYIDFPGYASAYPPLRSLPGIICNTSNIFEHILDIANRIILKKNNIIYPDMEQTPFIYLKTGKICIYNINNTSIK